MTSLFICIFAFLSALIAGRRSVVAGLTSTLAFGYAYGITRANLTETFSHFIFDAAVAGLYLSQIIRRTDPEDRKRARTLKLWLAALIGWPILLFLIPAQDRMVELVGLRGAIFLLPFLLIGVRLKKDELYQLALCICVLNIAAFSLAVVEFFVGVPYFYPKNPVTEIIYMGRDLSGYTEFRIPSSFTSAHAFAGTMVMTIPLLVGAWQHKRSGFLRTLLIAAALVASMLGVFMAAARVHAVVLFTLILVTTISSRFGWLSRVGWIAMLVGIGWIVSGEERLQRFMTLQEPSAVTDRVGISVNRSFLERAEEFPMGNGLGGGGTSVPYFLKDRLINPVIIENEYARIMLEEGIPGLCLWVAFLIWVFTRRTTDRNDSWFLGRRLMWVASCAYLFTGLIGVGLFLSVPQTCIMLISMGWITVRQPKVVSVPINESPPLRALQTSQARQSA